MGTLFLAKELTTLNKKILFGTISRQPEKYIMGLDDTSQSRTLAGLGLANSNKTPIFFDISEGNEEDN